MDRSIALLMFKVTIWNLTTLLRLQRVYMLLDQGGETLAQHAGIQDFVDETMCELFSRASETDTDADVEPKKEYVA